MADGLGQELDRTGLHGSNRHRGIGVTADEDDRQMPARLEEVLMKIRPALPWQGSIDNEASRKSRTRAVQELLNGEEKLDAQADRPEKSVEGLTNVPIIIDDDN